MPKPRTARISVSLPEDLLSSFDEVARKSGYFDRSKAVQMAMRNLMDELGWAKEEEGEWICVSLLVYDHDFRGLEEALTDIQHHHLKIVQSTMHHHIDDHNCLELMVVRGEKTEIRTMLSELGGKRGVKQLRSSFFQPV